MAAYSIRKIFIRSITVSLFVAMSSTVFAQMGNGGMGGYGGNRGGMGGRRGMNNQQPNTGRSERFTKAEYGDHGGEIKEVGKYKVEMVFDPLLKENSLSFYVTRKNKPLKNSEVSGRIEISYQDNLALEKQKLEPLGDDAFSAQIFNKTIPFICKLIITIEGKEFTENFYNRGFKVSK